MVLPTTPPKDAEISASPLRTTDFAEEGLEAKGEGAGKKNTHHSISSPRLKGGALKGKKRHFLSEKKNKIKNASLAKCKLLANWSRLGKDPVCEEPLGQEGTGGLGGSGVPAVPSCWSRGLRRVPLGDGTPQQHPTASAPRGVPAAPTGAPRCCRPPSAGGEGALNARPVRLELDFSRQG